jgi:LacI family transcriptional regulator
MVTISEIAEKANVSKTLVSRVLNGKPGVSPENRERIQSVINELNYHPNALARSLVTQKRRQSAL